MSIINTVYLPEGIAMAADSRLTGTTTYSNGNTDRYILSDNSQKLFLIKNNTIGIACCGDATIAEKSVGDFLRSFEIDEIVGSDTIIDIANKLKDYTMKLHGSGVVYHIAGYDNDVPSVYRVFNNIVKKENEDSDSNVRYGFMWDGETEALSKLVLSDPPTIFNFNFMQLKDGVDFAYFLAELTCKYQRFNIKIATCGGPIDVLVITKDYARFIKHKIFNP